MAGETIKTRAVCLAIRPWSRTSHVVTWLTPAGCVATAVKGAVRPKSAFLGQYDLNYTCEVLYYARAKGELHALRECSPLERRDRLRGDYRALVLAEWFRRLASDLAPSGPDAADWYTLLENALDGLDGLEKLEGLARLEGLEKLEGLDNLEKLEALEKPQKTTPTRYLQRLLDYELAVLRLAGLALEFALEDDFLHLRGERSIAVSPEVRACLANPMHEKNIKILVETARVIFVYYSFHLDCTPEVRRTVLRMISQ